ncbi:phage tail tape measure protein [Methylobacterium sp. J-068]|uniref:phage tail tape measure protein n=1 Tax=Methylobacterium sp. J-068 TaxID=2836649 RepID=UPI001FB9C601|nr:phage tail tape measure protein [Methylobacterium sp. J-068]MCJ2032624.1 phage tail tape measure protein [Methylobacterium sp. J-068]
MSTVSSTLALKVDDNGFADKLRADAEAARRLGTDAQGLSKLRANAGTAGLVRQLERLHQTATRTEGYQTAARALQTLGAGHRTARTEVEKTAATLARAQRRKDFFDRSRASGSANYEHFKGSGLVAEADAALRRAARAHTAATRTFGRTQEALQAQKTTVRALGSELERTGTPLHQIAQVQAGLRGRIEQTTAAIHRQARAHEEARVAAAASAAEIARRANAGLRAAVQGGAAARREREASVAAQRAAAGQRATAQLRATVQGAEGTRAARRAAAREAADQARRDNSDALRRTVQSARQERADREAAVAAEASRRRTAGRDMASGMGAAGRRQSADIEGGRRLTDGMSRPAREARERAAAERAAAEETRAEARRDQAQARKALVGIGGLALGHKVDEGTKDVLHTYKEFDDLRRYQAAVADLTPDESQSRVNQALHLGGTTRFNDLQALHAQLDLAQRGVKKEFVEPFVGEVVNYAQAMNTELGTAAKTLEGIVFSTNQGVEDPATAVKVMRRQVDLAVKMSKIGGLDNEDVAQAFKFGGASGSGAGLSNETMGTVFALLRRSGYTGSEAGVAQRALAGKLVSPTMKGLDALDAMGVKWENFSKIKRGAAPDLADNMMQRHFGKGLVGGQRDKMKDIFEDEDVMGDRQKFVEAAVDAVSGSFVQTKGKNKGKLSVVDRKALSKQFGNLHKNLIESIDSEGLLAAIINADPTLAQANAWGTDKHGGKIIALARKAKEFREYQEQLRHTPEGFAKDIGDKRNAGYAGAATRLAGSKKNFASRVGQSLDDNGQGGFLTNITDAAAGATQALAELPNSVIAVGASAAWLAGKVAELGGTALLVGASTGVATGVATGKGGAIAAGALAAGTAGVGAATVGAGLVAANLGVKMMPTIIAQRGAAGFDASTGFTPDANPMEGMAPEKPWAREWLKRKMPSVFGQREGSLPPGEAGMPKPAPARLPGLDGRPKPAVSRPGDDAMLAGRGAAGAEQMRGYGRTRDEAPIQRLPGFGTSADRRPDQPQEEGALARIRRRADEARANSASAAPPASPTPSRTAPPASAMPPALPAHPERAAVPVPAAAPAPAAVVPTGAGASPVPDAAKTQEATSALSAYRAELESVKSELAATSSLDLPGVSSGLEARKAELEHMIEGVQAKLREIGTQSVAPQVDTAHIDAVAPKAAEAKASLENLNATEVSPQVSTGGLDALIAKGKEALAVLQAVQNAASSANTAISRVNESGHIRPARSWIHRSNASFSDGVTPGAGAH